MFYQMTRYQKKLESKQAILNRIVDIGTELFAMATACSYANHLSKKENRTNAIDLADLYCQTARRRIEDIFRDQKTHCDAKHLKLARQILAKEFEWMEGDIIK